jgi:hypothetical protein
MMKLKIERAMQTVKIPLLDFPQRTRIIAYESLLRRRMGRELA